MDNSDIPYITEDEVVFAVRNVKLGNTPSDDSITTDLLEDVGEILLKTLAHQSAKKRKKYIHIFI